MVNENTSFLYKNLDNLENILQNTGNNNNSNSDILASELNLKKIRSEIIESDRKITNLQNSEIDLKNSLTKANSEIDLINQKYETVKQ